MTKKFNGIANIKAVVQPGMFVYFEYYHDGNLWYSTHLDEMFPVPISDVGQATMKHTDKAILFMRYMRLWNEELEIVRAESV